MRQPNDSAMALNLGWWGEWFDLTCFPLSIFCIQLLTFLPPPSPLVPALLTNMVGFYGKK